MQSLSSLGHPARPRPKNTKHKHKKPSSSPIPSLLQGISAGQCAGQLSLLAGC